MKRVFLIISFLALISCSENDGGPISVTRDDALLLVETLYGSYNTNIWISDRLIYESEILADIRHAPHVCEYYADKDVYV